MSKDQNLNPAEIDINNALSPFCFTEKSGISRFLNIFVPELKLSSLGPSM
jgi:hypothetical protein